MKDLAAYLRQSITKDDPQAEAVEKDLLRQRIAVDNWAKANKTTISHYYIDANAKRSEAEDIGKRPEFNRMLADAKAGKIGTIIISEQSRFGTADTHDFIAYIKTLRDLGVTLIEARSGCELTASSLLQIGPFLQSVIGSVASGMELQDKASQTLTGKIARVSTQGHWMGGPIAFGTSVTNYAPDGTEVWHQETVPGGSGFQYEITYPDGRKITRDQSCKDKSRGDIPRVEPSRIPGRVEAVQEAFRLFAKGVGCNTIARRLNELGYRTQTGGVFYPMFVHKLVERGIIFTGVYAYGQQSSGKYGNHASGTEYRMVDNPKGKTTKKARETWLTYQTSWQPVVSQETYDKARKRIQSKVVAPRSSKHDWAVYSRLLVCSGCGQPMTAWLLQGRHLYCCATYKRYGLDSKSGCGCNQVKQETIDGFLKRYLDDYGQTLSFAAAKSPLRALLAQLASERVEDCATARKIWDAIESYMFDKLADYFPFRTQGKARVFQVVLPSEHYEAEEAEITLPGCESPGILEELISLMENSDRSRYSGELERLTARHGHLCSLFEEAPKMMRAKLATEATEIEQRIEAIRASMSSSTSEYRTIMKRLAGFYAKAKETRAKLNEESPAVRREALGELLHAIRLGFRWEQRKGKQCSVLDSVTFEPQIGEPHTYTSAKETVRARCCA